MPQGFAARFNYKEDIMAKKKKKKLSVFTVAMLVVALVGAVLAVVGLFTEWTYYDVQTVLGDGSTDGMTLEDWAAMNDWGDAVPEYSVAMQTFAWMAAIFAVAGFALVLVRMLVNIGLIRLLGKIAGLGSAIFGILALVFTFVAGENFVGGGIDLGDLASATWLPAVGAYLTSIGAVVAGAGALLGSKK